MLLPAVLTPESPRCKPNAYPTPPVAPAGIPGAAPPREARGITGNPARLGAHGLMVSCVREAVSFARLKLTKCL